ncbi:MAG: ADP-ribosylglycohydrolase family protein [Bacilli bacterium]|nr:ADP-ribosylglycohydrolase family protein [Bacilli bacterium]
MFGAIVGDLAGSIYEFDQLRKIHSIQMNHLIEDNSFYSDDTILTIAILEAILHNKDYDYYLRKYIQEYSEYKPDFNPYFKTSFSPNLIKWSNSNMIGTSHGNGAMMRISPVGYMFDSETEVIENAKLATIPSHNSKEAIDSATIVALIIYYSRKGYTKDEIFQMMNIDIKYVPFTKFNTTCEETIGNCLYALYNSNSFEDAIRKTLLMGGDTDTNCAIVGSMAESIYGIDNELIEKVNEKIPQEFVKILKKSSRIASNT